MHTIEIDDHVYNYLLRNTVRIGESASDILRRLLKIPPTGSSPATSPTSQPGPGKTSGTGQAIPTEVSGFLSDPRLHATRDAVGKFLFLLSSLHQRDPKGFEKVLNLAGRRRKYFGRSSEELKQHGKSVFPKRIPDSSFWVVTNNDTTKKRRILGDVMRLLGYGEEAMNAVIKALA